jgi:hypothetical protein
MAEIKTQIVKQEEQLKGEVRLWVLRCRGLVSVWIPRSL